MIHLDFNVLIDRPVDQVFAYITKLANLPHWQSMIASVKQVSTDPVTLGTTFAVEANLTKLKFLLEAGAK